VGLGGVGYFFLFFFCWGVWVGVFCLGGGCWGCWFVFGVGVVCFFFWLLVVGDLCGTALTANECTPPDKTYMKIPAQLKNSLKRCLLNEGLKPSDWVAYRRHYQ